ncbi:hypothetical protein FRC17_005860 [Serendipita sp. 399]|nr:hypothetical protein FRC17_005860 [Serendipita sp. 399]
MDTNPKPAADVRAASVARLKRATSLPRMKDGRRPAVHGSDGEPRDPSTGITPSVSAATTPFTTSAELPPAAAEIEATGHTQDSIINDADNAPVVDTKHENTEDQLEHEVTGENEASSPPVLSKGRRRRSRSRGSRSGTPKLELPPSNTTSIITPIQRPTTPAATNINSVHPEHLGEATSEVSTSTPTTKGPDSLALDTDATPSTVRNRTFISPVSPFHQPISPLFGNGASPFVPIGATSPLPLAELQSSLQAGGLSRSVSVGRAHALHKLMGGNLSPSDADLFSGPSPIDNSNAARSLAASPADGRNAANTPPTASLISRSNTVAGEERVAARAAMFQKLRGRVGPVTPKGAALLLESQSGMNIHNVLTHLTTDPNETAMAVAGVGFDENMVNSGTEEVLVMPEIIARENKRKRRRAHKRSSSNAGALPSGAGSDDGRSIDQDHYSQGDYMSGDDRRFGSEANSASTGATPASQFSPLPATHQTLVSTPLLAPHSNVIRTSPSPTFTPPPAMALDTYVSLISGTSPKPVVTKTPDLPEAPRRIEELDEAELRRQEEKQARYFQGINLLRAASGEIPVVPGSGAIPVLIEEEDEPLPVPVLEPTSPTSPTQTELKERTSSPSRPSVDSIDASNSVNRPFYHSTTPSLQSQSSVDGQSSPGFGSMARVPIVMHQYGQDGQPTGFGRKGRIKAVDSNEESETPLVNFEPFPTSIILTPGKDQPIQYSEYPSEVDEDPNFLSHSSVPVGGSRTVPSPRAWNPKSSASWIVDSYFRDENDMGDYEELGTPHPPHEATPDKQEEGADPLPTPAKEEWDYVIPQKIPSTTLSAAPIPLQPQPPDTLIVETSQPVGASPRPSTRPEAPTPSSVVALTMTEEGDRISGLSSSDANEKGSSSSGQPGRISRPSRSSEAEAVDTIASRDSDRPVYGNSHTTDQDEDGSPERKGTIEKVSGWTRVKQTFIGRRRSRSNSFARERTEKAESGVSRESGASGKEVQTQATPMTAGFSGPTVGMLSAGSINLPRGVSPLPLASPADYAKYNDSKLMPFPGIYQLEANKRAAEAASAASEGQNQFISIPVQPNSAALSAPLPPSTRHSPDEVSDYDRQLQRTPSLGNMRQQDRGWPLPHEDYFEQGGSISRSASSGSNVKRWLKAFQSPSTSHSPSPSPNPMGHSPTPGLVNGEKTGANLNRRPSAAEIFLPHGGLHGRPSTPNILHGLSRKSSLADANNNGERGLRSATSKSSLRKAFGLFGHDTSKETAAPGEQAVLSIPIPIREDNNSNGTSPSPLPVQPEETPTPVASQQTAAPTEVQIEPPRPTSPAPLTLPSPSPVPIPLLPADQSTDHPPRTNQTPPPIARVRSPPPLHSRPQSPLSRAQSPSILKKEPAYRAQSPPIRAQSPGLDMIGNRSPSSLSPRSHSPFLIHSPSLVRSKSGNSSFTQKALSPLDILAGIDTLINRNSAGSIVDNKYKVVEDPPRKLLLVTPVLQVVSRDVAKDRTLFLFSDLLIVAKCMTGGEGGLPMDKLYSVRNILDLKRCTGPKLSAGSSGLSGDRRSPALQVFISEFKKDQSKAITQLCDSVGIGRENAPFIADVLFRTHDLDRPRLGDFLARRSSREILYAYVDKFNFSGIRIDHALRIFLLSLLLSDRAEPRSLENLLAGFASRWFNANGNTVAFDQECAKNLVISIVLLNASIHMTQAHHHAPASQHEFVEAVRAYDKRHSIKVDLLEDIYEAIKQEKISAPKENPNEPRLLVEIIGATNPMHFTYRVKSDFVRVRIPAPDPNFRIHLLGQSLIFEPPTLHFSNSAEATFRVTGTSLGTKSILYWRAGANAHLYSAMPLSSEIVVERAFMRNTLRVEVREPVEKRDSMMSATLESSKAGSRSYVFSIEDFREYDHWAKVLRTRINRAAGILEPDRPPTAQGLYTPVSTALGSVPPRIRRAAETVAFEVLKETLMGVDASSSSAASSPPETNIPKSAISSSFGHLILASDGSDIKDSVNGVKNSPAPGGILREGREIETLCVQNSLIPALISVLSVQRDSIIDNSQVGNGIGRPQTPKAINVIR